MEKAIIEQENKTITQALASAITLWADHCTDSGSARRHDLIRDKSNAVLDFFAFTDKPPVEIGPLDIKQWQVELENKGLAPASVYARISRVSSFFKWAIDNDLAQRNPVDMARPKPVKAYQSESTKALSDSDVIALIQHLREKADSGNIVAKRDLALTLLYFLTGMRRSEIISLKWGDIKVTDGAILLAVKVKGGEYLNREVAELAVKAGLMDYLIASGRLDEMEADSPLWTAHDWSGRNCGNALRSHGFAKNLKKYAQEAGIGNIHLHQARHTFARIVSEDTGSIIETQDALGHKNAATTRVYVQRIGVKKDKHSSKVAARLGL